MKYVPFSGGRLTTDDVGDLFLDEKKIGGLNDTVTVDWIDGVKEYDAINLIGFSVLRTYVPCCHWGKMTTKEITKTGSLGKRLEFFFNEPIVALDDGIEYYYFIPGYTQYAISPKQQLIHIASKSKIEPYVNDDGYRTYSIFRDDGPRSFMSRHRAMLLAFSKVPESYKSLDVNHLDCVPGNDDLENLEWATRSENMHHAVENGRVKSAIPFEHMDSDGTITRIPSMTKMSKLIKQCRRTILYSGLRGGDWVELGNGSKIRLVYPDRETRAFSTKKPVYIRHIKTGVVDHYPTIVSATKALNIPLATLRKRLARDTTHYYVGDVQVSHNDCWCEPKNYNGDGLVAVVVKDYDTGIVTKYPSINDCARALDIHKDTVAYRIYETGLVVCPDHRMYQLATEEQPWPEIRDIKAAVENYGVEKIVLVRNVITDEVSEFQSSTKFAKGLGLRQSAVSRWMSEKGQSLFRKKYQLKFKSDPTPWEILDNLEKTQLESGVQRKVLTRNLSTGLIKEYESAKECAVENGILTTTLNWRLKSNGLKTYSDGLQYKYKVPSDPWLIVS